MMNNCYFKCAKSFIFLFSSASFYTFANTKSFFDPALLEAAGVSAEIDLSVLEHSGAVIPGKYFSDIYLNGEYIEEKELTFIRVNNITSAIFTRDDLLSFGVKDEYILKDSGFLSEMLLDGKGEYRPETSRYDIIIPQINIATQVNKISKQLLNDGIPGIKLGYSLSGTDERDDGKFLSVDMGVNFFGIRYKQNINYNERYANNKKTRDLTFLNKYIEYDVYDYDSKVVLGDINTGGSSLGVFNSVPFRGVSIFSNTSINPNEFQYSPVISGVAYSNSTVYIRQNNRVIHQENVPPGKFEFKDIGFLGAGGQLEIEIKEEGGRSRKYIEYYNHVPGLLKPASYIYEFSLGRANLHNKNDKNAHFGLFSFSYGYSSKITLYNSMLIAPKYKSLALGGAFSLNQFGSISSDVSLSKGEKNSSDGASLQLRYAKSFLNTGTNIHLSAYRYSTKGFTTFNESLYINSGMKYFRHSRRKVSYEIRANQKLTNNINFYVSGRLDGYWEGKSNTLLNTGFNFFIYGATVTSSYSIDKSSRSNSTNRNALIQLTIPFSIFDRKKSGSISLSQYRNSFGNINNAVNINGHINDIGLSWSLSHSQSSFGSSAYNSSLYYGNGYGNYSVGYSSYNDHKKLNYNLNGGALIHPYGLTLTSTYPDTASLIKTNKVSNIASSENSQIKTDIFGYAVVPHLTPYRKNIVGINPESFSPGIDSQKNSHVIYPTNGAIVLADFPVRKGYQVFFKIKHKDAAIPFGAIVTLSSLDEKMTSIAGDYGIVYMGGIPQEGVLHIQWGRDSNHCKSKYKLDQVYASDYSIKEVEIECL
ncbi:fimbrial biogenesis outer membrane usher protein [Enterobacter roggenkampii]|uniref:fimbria/pilus outer membrane usher protein n=1 Tax=Enterobacter roggenkampii TaxID=1812935 RepID=UPI0022370AA8|nr:fimbria/pilus outer membrane usher protein [Enterobacter roggenkampii]MCW5004351.1 fimbrial biogenesis outer membrane usher protein [Enterobacter roggenkampii]